MPDFETLLLLTMAAAGSLSLEVVERGAAVIVMAMMLMNSGCSVDSEVADEALEN